MNKDSFFSLNSSGVSLSFFQYKINNNKRFKFKVLKLKSYYVINNIKI
jgi:hypothetical protein